MIFDLWTQIILLQLLLWLIGDQINIPIIYGDIKMYLGWKSEMKILFSE